MSAAPTRLAANHRAESFDSGVPAIDDWLRRHALAAQQAGTARSFVVCDGAAVIGFYSLAVGAVDRAAPPVRVAKGTGRHPIPVMLLARLAVDRRYGGRGIGKGLLKDALLRTTNAAEFAGIRALLVHAKNEAARTFYEHFDFAPSPLDSMQLMLLLKDVRKALTT